MSKDWGWKAQRFSMNLRFSKLRIGPGSRCSLLRAFVARQIVSLWSGNDQSNHTELWKIDNIFFPLIDNNEKRHFITTKNKLISKYVLPKSFNIHKWQRLLHVFLIVLPSKSRGPAAVATQYNICLTQRASVTTRRSPGRRVIRRKY